MLNAERKTLKANTISVHPSCLSETSRRCKRRNCQKIASGRL